MLNVNIPWEAIGIGQTLVFGLTVGYLMLWLLTLGLALTRLDLDPVTRLMWVIVIVFVPIFGIAFYFVLGPARPAEARPVARHGDSDITGTPWERDSGHRSRQ